MPTRVRWVMEFLTRGSKISMIFFEKIHSFKELAIFVKKINGFKELAIRTKS